MSNNGNLTDINYWRQTLGLLPVPLFSNSEQDERFVLLNGSKGNFCLDLKNPRIGDEARNYAWSSNVGHYIAIGDTIEVQRWDQRRTTIDRYNYQSVYDNLEKFHSYLESDAPTQGISVVTHSIGVFRRLRAVLGPDYDGMQCLKAFLYLLACATDSSEPNRLDLDRWSLSRDDVDIALSIRSEDWYALQSDLIRGRVVDELVPNLPLVLRHAAGQLFQEAHYEAVFVPQEQLTFSGLLPSSVRITKKHAGIGVHFTPGALSRALTEQALNTLDKSPNGIVIFDPACGSGEFLRETLRQLDLMGYVGRIKLIGWDQSQAATDMARFVLGWEKQNVQRIVDLEIRCTNSLVTEWPSNIDIVLMNPPFLSWQAMDAEQRQLIIQFPGAFSNRRPDLSYAFIWKAVSCIRPGGVLGTILPASVLDGVSAENLRKKLSEEMSPRLVARLGSHLLFSGALVDTALYVAKKGGETKDPTLAFWADYRSSSNSAGLRALRRAHYITDFGAYPVVGEGFSLYLNPTLGRDYVSWAPRPYKTWEILNSLRHLPKVGDLFDVKQGIRTGNNKAFILDKEEWESLPDKEKPYFRPAVVNRAIRSGSLNDVAYVFYPLGDKRIGSEQELQDVVSCYYEEHLLPNKRALLSRSRVNPDKWWELTLHRDWQIQHIPKLVSTYFGDAGSFAWDEYGKFVVLQGFAWLPRRQKLLPRRICLAYLAILNSELFSNLLSAVSNNVGGGQWNLSKKFVDNIALPDLSDEHVNSIIVSNLSKIGEDIHSEAKIDEKQLQELVRKAYGVDVEL